MKIKYILAALCCCRDAHLVKSRLKVVLAFFFIFFSLFGASAQNTSPKITLSEKNSSLSSVFDKIKKQSGYTFFYNNKTVKLQPPVSINIKDATIDEVLKVLLNNLPFTYSIVNKTIVITDKEPSKAETQPPGKAAVVVGTVSNEDHEGLEGATIRVKNKNNATTTIRNGVFTLPGAEDGDILLISYIGYAPAELPVTANKFMQVVLKHATSQLDEVQVVFNGQTSLRTSTGAQTTITHEQLAVSPAPNVLEAMAGLVPGLTITQNGSNAGSNFAITLRGVNTMPSSNINQIPYVNQPLILLDGFPLAQAPASAQGQLGIFGSQPNTSPNNSSNGLSVLFTLNPADIESVTVLKDADATAIYGTRGANGVILITSRHAKGGDLVAGASVEYGMTTYARQLDLMNTQQYLAMRREAFKNDGIAPTITTAPDLLSWSQTQDTNWQKELLGNKPTFNAGFNVAGGKGTTTFLANGGYFYGGSGIKGAPGDVLNSFKEERTTFSLSTQSISLNGRLHVDSHFDIGVYSSTLPSGSLESLIFLAPNAPALFDAGGNINWNAYPPGTYPDAAANILRPSTTKQTTTNTNLRLSYQIINGLTVNVQGAYSTSTPNTFYVLASAATTSPILYPIFSAAQLRQSNFSNGAINNFSFEPNIDYTRKIGKGFLDALAGVSYNDYTTNAQTFAVAGYVNDALQRSVAGGSSVAADAADDQQKLASIYARVNYNYNGRYILTLSGRRDGSSTFGPNRRWGTFGSAGGAWVFSDEEFAKPLKGNFFTFGKVRTSYGITGSPVTTSDSYLSTYTTSSIGYDGVNTFSIAQTSNPDIQWAVTKKLDVGADLGFLNDQLVLNADIYRTTTTNMLLTNYIAAVAGVTYQTANFPGLVQNKGLEIALNYHSDARHEITWSVGGNIAINRDKLVSFPNIQNSSYKSTYTVGQPIYRTRIYNLPPLDPQTGTYNYNITNQTGPNGYAFVNNAPKFAGGIQQGIGYKGFHLSLEYEYRSQNGFNEYGNNLTVGDFNSSLGNQLVSSLNDHWQAPGDQAKFPKFSTTTSETYFVNSNMLETQVFYLALKNARLSYTLQKTPLKKLKINSLTFNVSGSNLFYISNYKGGNPESPTAAVTPGSLMRRYLTAGVNANF